MTSQSKTLCRLCELSFDCMGCTTIFLLLLLPLLLSAGIRVARTSHSDRWSSDDMCFGRRDLFLGGGGVGRWNKMRFLDFFFLFISLNVIILMCNYIFCCVSRSTRMISHSHIFLAKFDRGKTNSPTFFSFRDNDWFIWWCSRRTCTHTYAESLELELHKLLVLDLPNWPNINGIVMRLSRYKCVCMCVNMFITF